MKIKYDDLYKVLDSQQVLYGGCCYCCVQTLADSVGWSEKVGVIQFMQTDATINSLSEKQ